MLRSNTFNKIIAFAAALTLWAYVITVQKPIETKTIRDIPVHFANMELLADNDLTIANDTAYTIEVSVEGRRTDILNLTASDFSATADLRGRQKGEATVPVEVIGPNTVSITNKRPQNILLMIEELVSVMKPVKVEFSEGFETGTEPGFVSVMPEETEVSGAKSRVDEVAYVRLLVNADELRSAMRTFNVAPQPMSAAGEPIYAPMRFSPAEAEVSAVLCEVRELPLRVEVTGEIDSQYEVTRFDIPKTVRVRGTAYALSRATEITANPVNISGTEVTTRISLSLRMPKDIELASGASATIAIALKGIATKEFTYTSDEIAVDGLPDGYTARVGESVTLAVAGTEGVVSTLRKEDARVSVDASAFGGVVGTVTLPLRVTCSKELRKTTLNPQSVTLYISEQPRPAPVPVPTPDDTGGDALPDEEDQL